MNGSDALGMFILAALLAIAPAADAQTSDKPTVKAPGKPGVVVVEAVTFRAKVAAVDKDKRLITLTDPKGNSATVKAGPEVKNFDHIKSGDTLTVRPGALHGAPHGLSNNAFRSTASLGRP